MLDKKLTEWAKTWCKNVDDIEALMKERDAISSRIIGHERTRNAAAKELAGRVGANVRQQIIDVGGGVVVLVQHEAGVKRIETVTG